MTLKDWLERHLIRDSDFNWKDLFKEDPPVSFPGVDLSALEDLLIKSDQLPGFLAPRSKILPILLGSGNPLSALQQLHDFAESYALEHNKPFDFSSPQAPELLSIFGRSDYLSRRLIRDPKFASEFCSLENWKEARSSELMLKELRKKVRSANPETPEDLKKILRRWKYREFLRISIRDFCLPEAFVETLEEWASVAESLLQVALETIHEILQKKDGVHFPEPPFMILGMGKLGGKELNHSSDVDLIFIHDDLAPVEQQDQSNRHRIKVARSLIDVMSDLTEEGFLARVDMRLRPGGDRAPLVQSLDEVELYYSAKGELWERQALIKGRTVAGCERTKKSFESMITPFVYSRLLDERLSRDIQHMKERIEEEHLRENQLNVKLGVGGIREIEFFVQTFQLLYGGRRKSLRKTNTLEALEAIEEVDLIPALDGAHLKRAYIFLRRVEHRLQMREEQQTHTIPSNAESQRHLARCMGYDDLDPEKARQQFLSELKDVMGRVRSIFSGLFSNKHLEIEAALRNSLRIQNLSEEEKDTLQNLAQSLTPYLNSHTEKRFQRLFETIGPRIDLYQPLLEGPSAISRLARIGETSEMLWNHLLNHLELLNRLEQKTLEVDRKDAQKQLRSMLSEAEGDEEQQIDRLRQFKHAMTFLLGSAELEGILSYSRARKNLTLVAEIVLEEAFRMAMKKLDRRFGNSLKQLEDPLCFAIIGLGKLGGRELTYHSDLDLIIVHSGKSNASQNDRLLIQEYGVKLIQRTIFLLTTITRSGFAYTMDTRLRPSGNAGVLVTPWEVYFKYHRNSQAWEHQALVKGRIVAGATTQLESDGLIETIGEFSKPGWFEEVESGIEQAAYEWEIPEDLASQIHHLRSRKEKELSAETDKKRNLKEGRGGLLDVEFLTQYLQLVHGRDIPEMRTTETLKALENAGKHGLLNQDQVSILSEGYRHLRLIENGLRLLYDDSTNMLDFDRIDQPLILMLLKRHGYETEDLFKTVEKTTSSIRQVYSEIMERA